MECAHLLSLLSGPKIHSAHLIVTFCSNSSFCRRCLIFMGHLAPISPSAGSFRCFWRGLKSKRTLLCNGCGNHILDYCYKSSSIQRWQISTMYSLLTSLVLSFVTRYYQAGICSSCRFALRLFGIRFQISSGLTSYEPVDI